MFYKFNQVPVNGYCYGSKASLITYALPMWYLSRQARGTICHMKHTAARGNTFTSPLRVLITWLSDLSTFDLPRPYYLRFQPMIPYYAPPRTLYTPLNILYYQMLLTSLKETVRKRSYQRPYARTRSRGVQIPKPTLRNPFILPP